MSRSIAFDVLRQVTSQNAYANLALKKRLATAGLAPRDSAFVTELVSGTCRLRGTYDRIIAAASGRSLKSFQPAVIDVLRLGAHQLLSMRIPAHAAVGATVDLAKKRIGNRVSGIVNAVLRRVSAQNMAGWLDQLTQGASPMAESAIRGHHPIWIVKSFSEVLPADELDAALAANNVAPEPTLVVRPGLAEVEELGTPTRYSPFGAHALRQPEDVAAVAQGRAGVQDEGSQLVAWALTRPASPDGPWLDICAGPGGKSALLAGLAQQQGSWLLASELHPHRAQLVSGALHKYQTKNVLVADGLRPAWRENTFSRVMVDVPCTGLGALRRRPEARWRRTQNDLSNLTKVQTGLLATAIRSAQPGGIIAYVTCSPHRAETTEIVDAFHRDVTVLNASDYLPNVPNCALGRYVQLWPHRHGTDAMFLALLKRR